MPYPYKSFRDWFAAEEEYGEVVRIKTPIKCGDYDNLVELGQGIPGKRPESEMRALARYLHGLPGKPTGFIENPVNNRPDIPVVINPWATRERVLRGMGLKTNDDLVDKFNYMQKNKIKPIVVSREQAACKENVIPEEKLDLRKDIPRCWVEFNQCLWTLCNGTVIVRDEKTGNHSLGKCRLGQNEWGGADQNEHLPEERLKRYMIATMNRGGPRLSNSGKFYMAHRAQGKPAPMAYVFGLPPDLHEVAALKALQWPESGDEYDMVGVFRGEPIEVVESETIPGLMLPAHAEWVVEGEFNFEEESTPYCGEDFFAGFMVGNISWPVFKVKCITHCNNPWWSATTFSSNGLNGHEGTHSALAVTHVEADATLHLRRLGFKVRDVACLVGPMITVIQLDVAGLEKPYPYYGKKVGLELATYGAHVNSSYIIVVGPDINPRDPMDVWWALAMYTMPVTDQVAMTDTFGVSGGFGSRTTDVDIVKTERRLYEYTGEQVIIDATIPIPERYDMWQPRSEPPDWERAAIERMKKKLGGL